MCELGCVGGGFGCVGGTHELLRACIARASLACSSSSTCFAPITDALARPLGTNIQNLGPLGLPSGLGRAARLPQPSFEANEFGEKSKGQNSPRNNGHFIAMCN